MYHSTPGSRVMAKEKKIRDAMRADGLVIVRGTRKYVYHAHLMLTYEGVDLKNIDL